MANRGLGTALAAYTAVKYGVRTPEIAIQVNDLDADVERLAIIPACSMRGRLINN